MQERSPEYLEVSEKIQNLLLDFKDLNLKFRRERYADAFEDFRSANEQLLFVYHDLWEKAEDGGAWNDEIAQSLAGRAKENVDSLRKTKQAEKMYEYNLTLVTFFNPLLAAFRHESSDELVDKVIDSWNETFPKYKIQKSDFEAIQSGFRKRFCYITTAVCSSLGRDDDCYELNVLRDFRDGYMASLPEGKDMIDHYYDLAPSIVKSIEAREGSEEIYREIWNRYLAPCISDIEADDREACLARYAGMVEDLASEFVYN